MLAHVGHEDSMMAKSGAFIRVSKLIQAGIEELAIFW
jgi:hypothetical protein